MAPHSSTLAWKIPWTEKPGGLQSMGWLRVGHDWATSLSLFIFLHWRRKWQPTPVFLPGESQGWGILVGCCLWGHTESDTTEATQHSIQDPSSSTSNWTHAHYSESSVRVLITGPSGQSLYPLFTKYFLMSQLYCWSEIHRKCNNYTWFKYFKIYII